MFSVDFKCCKMFYDYYKFVEHLKPLHKTNYGIELNHISLIIKGNQNLVINFGIYLLNNFVLGSSLPNNKSMMRI